MRSNSGNRLASKFWLEYHTWNMKHLTVTVCGSHVFTYFNKRKDMVPFAWIRYIFCLDTIYIEYMNIFESNDFMHHIYALNRRQQNSTSTDSVKLNTKFCFKCYIILNYHLILLNFIRNFAFANFYKFILTHVYC